MTEEPIDSVGPWTIKSVPTSTKEAIIKASRQEGLTVGQWMEKRVSEWISDGSPVAVAGMAEGAGLSEIAHLMAVSMACAEKAGVPVSKTMARDGMSIVRLELQKLRPPKNQKPPAQLDAPKST